MPSSCLRLLFAIGITSSLAGCSGGLSARTREMRTALDAGDPRRAITHLNRELGVRGVADRPRRLVGEQALLLLDRATIQQSIAQLANSKRDYEAADKAIDALDLSHGASDDIGRWVSPTLQAGMSRRRTRSCSSTCSTSSITSRPGICRARASKRGA